MKVLVTGAGGFIGSHLTEELIKRGEEVRAFLRYNSQGDIRLLRFLPKRLQSKIEYFFGDIKDPDSVRRAVRGCKKVYHLAALIAIPYSYINPNDFVQTNVTGTANLLNACRDDDVEKIIHTSTSEVYGTARYVPIDEKHPLQGQSPYAASKIGADQLAESYFRAFDLPVVIVRPFNTYGPRQSLRAIIPTIIMQLLSKRKTLRLGSVHPTRDFLFVKDTVRGFAELGRCSGAVGKTVNLGIGKEISIKELARKIGELMGVNVVFATEKKRIRPGKSEVEQLCADSTLAQRLINWKPRYFLKDGLTKTIEWFGDNPDISRSGEYQI